MDIAKQRIAEWLKQDARTVLDLSSLDLEMLPDIPEHCRSLCCSYNKLTTLPDMPHCYSLICTNNLLTTLPDMPNCYSLTCTDNLLTKLPNIPHCERLKCDNNLLSHIPNNDYTHLTCQNNKYLYVTPKMIARYNLIIDKRTINYPVFATKIQRTYAKYKQKRVFEELNKIYIKNMAMLISLYC